MPNDVAIIDSGGANLASLEFALKRLGASPAVTADPTSLRRASHVILPGVGAAADAMQRLAAAGLVDIVRSLTQPVLGICLGLQLLAERSAENDAQCIGVVQGRSELLPASVAHPVPNMGWCQIENSANHPLLEGIRDGDWFYFVHSFALAPTDYSIATARHAEPFTAILAQGNFMATQFHPERSSQAGARLLKNFLAIPS